MDAVERKQILRLYRIDERRTCATTRGLKVIPLEQLLGEREGEQLSDREIDVLQLAADGFTNREIGRILSVSDETVKSHIRLILAKLPAKNRANAVAIACRLGVVR